MSKKRKRQNAIKVPITSKNIESEMGTTSVASADESATYQTNATRRSVVVKDTVVSDDVSRTTSSVAKQTEELRQTTTKDKKSDVGQVLDQDYDSTRPRPIRIKAKIIYEPDNN